MASFDVRIDRDVFIRYRALQNQVDLAGGRRPSLGEVTEALLLTAPASARGVQQLIARWRAADARAARPQHEREMHRMRVEVRERYLAPVRATLEDLAGSGDRVSLRDVLRAMYFFGPSDLAGFRALLDARA